MYSQDWTAQNRQSALIHIRKVIFQMPGTAKQSVLQRDGLGSVAMDSASGESGGTSRRWHRLEVAQHLHFREL